MIPSERIIGLYRDEIGVIIDQVLHSDRMILAHTDKTSTHKPRFGRNIIDHPSGELSGIALKPFLIRKLVGSEDQIHRVNQVGTVTKTRLIFIDKFNELILTTTIQESD